MEFQQNPKKCITVAVHSYHANVNHAIMPIKRRIPHLTNKSGK